MSQNWQKLRLVATPIEMDSGWDRIRQQPRKPNQKTILQAEGERGVGKKEEGDSTGDWAGRMQSSATTSFVVAAETQAAAWPGGTTRGWGSREVDAGGGAARRPVRIEVK